MNRSISRIKTGTFIVVLLVLVLPQVGRAEQLRLNTGLSTPFMLCDKKDTAYLRVGLAGFEMKDESKRTPVNVAIVLDRSGSMSGKKIESAKEAALQALRRLGPEDVVSFVTYESTVNVVVPATKMTDRETIEAVVRRIKPGGSTALFAGVSKAGDELRKFLSDNRVNRVILLSDGLANVGPSSTEELGDLGASLAKEGICVTTIGLGLDYNEDLLMKLAVESGGNHFFAENARDLARIYDQEFGDVLSVVAQEVSITVRCSEGIRPIRVIAHDADITGQEVVTGINQIYSKQQKYVVLEVEVPASENGAVRKVADVKVTYANMQTKTTDELTATLSVTFTDSKQLVEEKLDARAMIAAIRLIGAEQNALAVSLRDQGRIEEAKKVFAHNNDFLMSNAIRYNSEYLRTDAGNNIYTSEFDEDSEWNKGRKRNVDYQFEALEQLHNWDIY